MRLVPFEPDHIRLLANYGGQEHLVPEFTERDIGDLATHSAGYTAIASDNTIAGCAGIARANRYRGIGWGLFSRTSPVAFLGIHLAARRVIRESGFKIIEAYVDPNFAPGMRWIRQLGFTMDRPYLPYYFPDGSGAARFVLYPGEW